MSETTINMFKWALEQLSWQDFQLLGFHFLQDIGYTANIGKMPGNDGGVDFHGVGPHGKFAGFSTTYKQGSKRKLATELRNAAMRGSYEEYIIWNLERPYGAGKDQEFIHDFVIPIITNSDPRKKNCPPRVQVFYSDRIAREVNFLPDSSKSKYFLRSRARDAFPFDQQDLTTTKEDKISTQTTNPKARIIDLLSRQFLSLPEGHQINILQEVLELSWNTIAFDPSLAIQARQLLQPGSSLASSIEPVIKYCLGEEILSTDLINLEKCLSPLSEDSSFSFSIISQQYLSRVIRACFYCSPETLGEGGIIELFHRYSEQNDPFWDIFFIDLFLRTRAGRTLSSPKLERCLEKIFKKKQAQHANNAMIRVYPYINSPLEWAEKLSWETFLSSLYAIGRSCQTELECKWCIAALNRMAPLFEQYEQDDEIAEPLESLIDEFDPEISSSSNLIQYLRAKNALRLAAKLRSVRHIQEMENIFLDHLLLFIPIQTWTLQMEYASALYVLLQFGPAEVLRGTIFWEQIDASPGLTSCHMLHNEHIAIRKNLAKPPDKQDKRSLFLWLTEYAETIYRATARPLIEANHLRLFDYSTSRRPFPLRKAFSDSVERSLESLSGIETAIPPWYAIRTLGVFSLVSRTKYKPLTMELLRRALAADTYALARDGNSVFKSLYSLHYYAEEKEVRSEALSLALTFGKSLRVGEGLPRPYWATCAAIFYKNSIADQDFVKMLFVMQSNIFNMSRKVTSVQYRSKGALFPDELSDTIRKFSEDSLLASTLKEEIIHPEIWNLIGTTVINNPDLAKNSLEIGAMFYRVAIMFARSMKLYDQKYNYNYIKANSLWLLSVDSPPNAYFLRESLFFLTTFPARQFSYRKENLLAFLGLIKASWPHLGQDERSLIGHLLPRARWLRRIGEEATAVFDLLGEE